MSRIKNSLLFWVIIGTCIIAVLAVSLFFYDKNVSQKNIPQQNTAKKQPKIRWIQLQPYPKTITVINNYDHSKKDVPIGDFSRFDQFVSLNNGKEVDATWKADAIVWIYKEEITPLGKNGEIVPFDKAVQLTIKQYGKDDILLRERTIDAPTNTVLPPPTILPGKK